MADLVEEPELCRMVLAHRFKALAISTPEETE